MENDPKDPASMRSELFPCYDVDDDDSSLTRVKEEIHDSLSPKQTNGTSLWMKATQPIKFLQVQVLLRCISAIRFPVSCSGGPGCSDANDFLRAEPCHEDIGLEYAPSWGIQADTESELSQHLLNLTYQS